MEFMMKKILWLLSLAALPLWLSAAPSACTKGKEALTCKKPCGHFVDKDGDGQCDLNQPLAEPPSPASSSSAGELAATVEVLATAPVEVQSESSPYSPLAWSLAPLLAYAVTSALSRSGRMKRQAHRYFWNVVLFAAFAVSCGLGTALACALAYDWHPGQFYDWMLAWHVNAGIAMLVLGAVHMGSRFRYFLRSPLHGKNG